MIDFDALNAQLLTAARDLLPAWLPAGRWRGREFVVGNIRGDAGDSLSINSVTGKWADFSQASGGARGGDLVALYAAIHGLSQIDAARRLGAPDRPNGGSNGFQDGKRSNGHGAPAPSGAPAPAAVPEPIRAPPEPYSRDAFRHRAHGLPSATYVYHAADGTPLFVVCRYDPVGPDGETARKQIVPWVWNGREWRPRGYPAPRPLYGLDRLARFPDVSVILVEGEKTADAAATRFPGQPCVTWCGGVGQVGQADFAPLYGRRIVMWPDNDEPGRQAMATIAETLLKRACTISLIDPSGWPEKWDLADAQPDDDVLAYAAAHIKALVLPARGGPPTAVSGTAPTPPPPESVYEPPPPDTDADLPPPDVELIDAEGHLRPEVVPLAVQPGPRTTAAIIPAAPAVGSLDEIYQRYGFNRKSNGRPYCNEFNVTRAIACRAQSDAAALGAIYYDEFADQIMVETDGRAEVWSDHHTLRLMLWLQQTLELYDINTQTVHEGVVGYALAHRRNPVRDWIRSLVWDNQPRLAQLCPIGFGTFNDPYYQAVGRCFMVGMVARVMRPGCQVDSMPVFEGAQGNGKTSALRILGGEYFAEIHESIKSKDFVISLAGKMLCEISELGAFKTADIERIKGIITTTYDRYRAPYAKIATDHPRQGVFSGTTNRDDWNTDETGARRFWPVACRHINLEWIAEHRDQLFAEALYRFQDGESWWDVPVDAAEAARAAREDADPWEDLLNPYLIANLEVRIPYLLTEILGMKADKMDASAQRRLGRILKRRKYAKVVKKDPNGSSVRVWVRG